MSQKNKTFGHGGSPPCTCDRWDNPAKPVQIGGHTIWAGGGTYLLADNLDDFHRLIDLRAERLPKGKAFGPGTGTKTYLPIVDYGTVSEVHWQTWKRVLVSTYSFMGQKEKIIVFCAGGHGRTGLFLASLLAMAEPDVDDPVAEIRRRYCPHAVETEAQRAQVMRLLQEIRRSLAPTS